MVVAFVGWRSWGVTRSAGHAGDCPPAHQNRVVGSRLKTCGVESPWTFGRGVFREAICCGGDGGGGDAFQWFAAHTSVRYRRHNSARRLHVIFEFGRSPEGISYNTTAVWGY